jgi:hypothetical protein
MARRKWVCQDENLAMPDYTVGFHVPVNAWRFNEAP